MTIPKKALILYCPCEPNEAIPNVDLLTAKGCSGQLILEATGMTQTNLSFLFTLVIKPTSFQKKMIQR